MSDPTPPAPKKFRVLRLQANNIKRLKAIDIHPPRNVVGIGGQNDQGKTTTLDCIEYVLRGAGSVCDMPLRIGSTRGDISIDLGELRAMRTFKAAGASTLKVEMADGTPVKSPQEILDKLFSKLSFDPMEFVQMKPDKQVETLRKLVGLDFTDVNTNRQTAYNARTEINRQLDQAKVKLQTMKHHADAPEEPVSVKALMEQQSAVRQHNAANAEKRVEHDTLIKDRDKQQEQVDNVTARLKALRSEITQLESDLAVRAKGLNLTNEFISDSKAAIDLLVEQDEQPIIDQINAADETNAKVRENKSRLESGRAVTSLETRANALTDQINKIDKDKETLLSEAKFPLEGLSFNDSGVTYKGVPFSQAGTAVKMLTSMKIAHALNPTLPVILIRDAVLLDEQSMKVLTDFAVEQDLQVWLELIGEGKGVSVVIEDGAIRES